MLKKVSLSAQNVLNIIGSIVVVAINVIINFMLSPYIIKHLGVEANGYITLANNFVSYIGLVTIALNSMTGRFILIDYRKGNQQSANEYYSSVLIGNWIIMAVLLLPMVFFVIFIEKVISVPPEFLSDTRILFAIVFVNYMVHLCLPQWRVATYCTNNLYIRSLQQAITAIIRALSIYLLFMFLPPHSYYVAVSASIMTVAAIAMDYGFYKVLMPELQWKIAYFRIKKIKGLILSGIWNTISQCGNLLLEGLDILIANILINPVASGVLALSKIVPNMITQITGSIATTYGPRLTYLFADDNMKGMEREVKNDMLYVAIIANLPIGIFIAFGQEFFSLWVPSQSASQLFVLSGLSLIGMLFMGPSQCVVNIFGVANILRLNSIVVIASGLVNVASVYILLKYTSLGVAVIAGVSSVVSIIRIFAFTLPYGAYCIKANPFVFFMPLLKSVANVIIPIIIGLAIGCFLRVNGWWSLVFVVLATSLFTVVVDYFVVLNKEQRGVIAKLIFRK